VVGVEVLHYDERHPGMDAGRHGGEELFDGRQSPGGGADADDGKTLLDHLGLTAAMERFVEEFQERSGIACDLDVNKRGIRLDQDRSLALYRILQEALTNVARHADAGKVGISLEVGEGTAMLRVEDGAPCKGKPYPPVFLQIFQRFADRFHASEHTRIQIPPVPSIDRRNQALSVARRRKIFWEVRGT